MTNDKTNVMRVLDQAKLEYKAYAFDTETAPSAMQVANILNIDPARVFKTLVTVGKSGNHYVFVIPAPCELDLKKAAAAVHEKNIEMIKSKELLPLTGYIHGGCSPIAMKKFLKTTIDESCILYDTIVFSAGKIGRQVEMSYEDLHRIIEFDLADLCVL